ncbi:FKBP-type peptidylprolyl isomerase [Mucilaginibacter achroorhodeus]|uniref:peptidylprolyl isomerase n=1 Tax=Mucilaginibacter achroorhodeus TaxID=2599294 RepID=A0A563U9W8_9SPHI|nr:FKBP-type peptidyl-prolyl cis-trans isomerase [Mucilaginibacter achroorhodeus]TWR28182.1 FKBP-type peptidylprolyl isomerase [Mucilaginibacter achroorhodeus]
MRKNLMIMAVAALAFAGCKSGFKQADGGLLYSFRTDKTGATIKEGDFVSADLILKNEADSVMGSTYDMGRPAPLIYQKPQRKGDITSIFPLLSEGDSVTIKVNIDSMFTKGQPKPPGLKGKYLIYEVKVQKVIAKGGASDPVFQKHISDYFQAQKEAMLKKEPAAMNKYVADKNLKVTKTASGIMYQITKPGSGPNIQVGDTAVLNYTGRLLNGKVFDSSLPEETKKIKGYDPRRKPEPIKVKVGAGNVIKGWDEGLLLLNKGAKATFVIPSELGYGEQGIGNGVIPAYAPLTFDVEILNIIKTDPNAPKATQPMMMPQGR